MSDQSSDPYRVTGRQREEYNLWDVMGWRQPNLAPIEFKAKKALLPAEQRLDIFARPDVVTRRRIPR